MQDVEAALAAEMESTQQLGEDMTTIVDRQPPPDDLSLLLNQERQLHGKPPVDSPDSHREDDERQTNAKKRGRDDAAQEETTEPAADATPDQQQTANKRALKRQKADAAGKEGEPAVAAAAAMTQHPGVVALQEEVRSKSMDVVRDRIPAKIIATHNLYHKLVSEMKPLADVADVPVPNDATPTPHFVSNERTQELVRLVKAEIVDLVEIISAVRLWLQFNIPPAGGQDFDSKVKEEIANEMEQVNLTGKSVIDTLKNYPITRGLLFTQITKHRNVDDFRNGLPFLDFHHQLNLQRWVKDLRNMYLSLNNTLKQNVAELSAGSSDAAASSGTRRRRLSDSLSPPTARRRGSTGRRGSSSTSSSPLYSSFL